MTLTIVLAYMLRIVEGGVELDDHEGVENPHYEFRYLGDALWFIYTTYLTIGYGDLFPKTNLGRVIGIVTSLIGTAITSLAIVTMLEKFNLNGYEKNVHPYNHFRLFALLIDLSIRRKLRRTHRTT
jgi:hypothetical protein